MRRPPHTTQGFCAGVLWLRAAAARRAARRPRAGHGDRRADLQLARGSQRRDHDPRSRATRSRHIAARRQHQLRAPPVAASRCACDSERHAARLVVRARRRRWAHGDRLRARRRPSSRSRPRCSARCSSGSCCRSCSCAKPTTSRSRAAWSRAAGSAICGCRPSCRSRAATPRSRSRSWPRCRPATARPGGANSWAPRLRSCFASASASAALSLAFGYRCASARSCRARTRR